MNTQPLYDLARKELLAITNSRNSEEVIARSEGFARAYADLAGRAADETERAEKAEAILGEVGVECVRLNRLWAILDEALGYGNITGGMYREGKEDPGSPMWMGPMVRNGACSSAKELAEELLENGFRERKAKP